MKRRAGISFAAALLALSFWSMTGYSADDEDDDKKAIKEAQEAVIKLVDSMNGKKADVKTQVETIHKKFPELKHVMWVYKPRNKGGIGMGKDGASIETEINKLGSVSSKAKLTPQKLASMKDDLVKAGEISQALAVVADLYVPRKNPAKWKEYTSEMRKGAAELMDAAKSGDVAKVKKAANNLSASCTNCHSDFRD
jgi:cytochrome c556